MTKIIEVLMTKRLISKYGSFEKIPDDILSKTYLAIENSLANELKRCKGKLN